MFLWNLEFPTEYQQKGDLRPTNNNGVSGGGRHPQLYNTYLQNILEGFRNWVEPGLSKSFRLDYLAWMRLSLTWKVPPWAQYAKVISR